MNCSIERHSAPSIPDHTGNFLFLPSSMISLCNIFQNNPEFLKNVLLYHVTNSPYSKQTNPTEVTFDTLLGDSFDEKLKSNRYSETDNVYLVSKLNGCKKKDGFLFYNQTRSVDTISTVSPIEFH